MMSAAPRTKPRSVAVPSRREDLIDRKKAFLVDRLNADGVRVLLDLEVDDPELRQAARRPVGSYIADTEGAPGHLARRGKIPHDVLGEAARLHRFENQRG